jgi:hypothetical protein
MYNKFGQMELTSKGCWHYFLLSISFNEITFDYVSDRMSFFFVFLTSFRMLYQVQALNEFDGSGVCHDGMDYTIHMPPRVYLLISF